MGPSAESLEPSLTHVNCVGQTKFCVPKKFEIRSFVCSDRIDISPTKVNSLLDVNPRSNQTYLNQLCDRQLSRPVSYPPNENVNPRSSKTHLSQPRDRRLSRPSVCPPNVNLPTRQTCSLTKSSQTHLGQSCDHHLPKPDSYLSNVNLQPVDIKVNSQPVANRRLGQTHLDQLRDHRLPKPTSCLLVYPSGI